MVQGRVLGVWAHPDDEAFVAGGLLGDLARRGSLVRCVHATAGEAGQWADKPVSPSELARVREAELAVALEQLGVQGTDMLGLPDGGLVGVSASAAVERLRAELVEFAPDVVVTFGADGFTGHPDHRCLSGWVTAAVVRWGRTDVTVLHSVVGPEWVDRFAPALDEFDVFSPGFPRPSAPTGEQRVLCLDEGLLDAKMAALRAHASQLGPLFEAYGESFMRALCSVEVFERITLPASPDSVRPLAV